MKKVLTTGEIADYCGVNFRTVIRWIERGHLAAYKLPGRGDNRVQMDNFLTFLKENKMPVPKALQASLEEHEHPQRALIVDDDEHLAGLLTVYMSKVGFETRVATDGFQAGSQLVTYAPHIMTLDLDMPGINGFGVLRFARSQETLRNVKILVISGLPEEEQQSALASGADDILQKPFEQDMFLKKVEYLTRV